MEMQEVDIMNHDFSSHTLHRKRVKFCMQLLVTICSTTYPQEVADRAFLQILSSSLVTARIFLNLMMLTTPRASPENIFISLFIRAVKRNKKFRYALLVRSAQFSEPDVVCGVINLMQIAKCQTNVPVLNTVIIWVYCSWQRGTRYVNNENDLL